MPHVGLCGHSFPEAFGHLRAFVTAKKKIQDPS